MSACRPSTAVLVVIAVESTHVWGLHPGQREGMSTVRVDPPATALGMASPALAFPDMDLDAYSFDPCPPDMLL
jgi:hypothetical protein